MAFSALSAFNEKLRANGIDKQAPNRYMVPLAYAKCLLSAPLSAIERSKVPHNLPDRDPEKSPLFILGHWRSGTTFLQFLLNQDPNLCTQTKYQALLPGAFATTEGTLKPLLSRLFARTKPARDWQRTISKSMNLDTPAEAELALISQVYPHTYHWAHLFPQAWRYYFQKYLLLNGMGEEVYQDWLHTYGQYLHKLYWYHEDGRLLVKNPGDTARIQAILQLFPNARFIFIHRNPYEVYYSNQRLWHNVQQSLALQRLSAAEQQELILEVYKWLHEAYLQQKPLLRHDQLVEISYEDLLSQPEYTLAHAYEQLRLPGFEAALPHFRRFIQQNLGWNFSHYTYQPEDLALINEHWGFAFDHWGYSHMERA